MRSISLIFIILFFNAKLFHSFNTDTTTPSMSITKQKLDNGQRNQIRFCKNDLMKLICEPRNCYCDKNKKAKQGSINSRRYTAFINTTIKKCCYENNCRK